MADNATPDLGFSPKGLYIGGEWQDSASGASFASINPSNRDHLGDLPLALEHAGAYIDIHERSFSDYLDLFKTHQPQLLAWLPQDASEDTVAVATTWNLSLQQAAEAAPAAAETRAGAVVYMTKPLDRPVTLPGRTYKLRWPESDHAIYITLNDVVQDGRRRPFEIFINSKNMEHYAWTVALTRMISAVFRRGGDITFVVEELKAVFDPRGGHWVKGRYVPSLLAAIGEAIEQHMIEIGFLTDENRPAPSQLAQAVNADGGAAPAQCPKCGQPGLTHQEGCDLCPNCGYSKCEGG